MGEYLQGDFGSINMVKPQLYQDWDSNENPKNASENISQIEDFYKDQTIFITGATGFLGTLLVEKLLRCCPNLKKLILLIRNSKNRNVNERVREYFCEEIFDQMKLENPNYYQQVEIISGHLEKDGFGLNDNETRFLISNTNVILHVAATVRFDENIRVAYVINVKGTKTLISLAKKMKQLKSFVYVSTAYSNCDLKVIGEKFYSPVYSGPALSTLIEACSDEELAILNDIIIDKKPNTYTLTKSTAEDLIREVSSELPVCVFRPSIVLPTLEDPIPLWFKSINTVLALCAGCGVGLIRVCMVGEESTPIEVVPADRVTSALVAVAWYQTTSCDEKVFNYISANDNKISFTDFVRLAYRTNKEQKEGVRSIIWSSSMRMTKSKTLYLILFYLLQIFPGIFFAAAEKLTTRKPMIFKTYRRLMFLFKIATYFFVNEWQFSNANTRAMWNAMSDRDRRKFDSTLSNFQWESMVLNFNRSIAKYMLKEQISKEYYQKHLIYIDKVDFWISCILKIVFLYFLLSFVAFLLNKLFLLS